MAELFWVLFPYCSLPGCPFPIKSLAFSAHVSPRTIHFRVLGKSPISGPGRGPPSCNIIISILLDRKMRPRKVTCPGQLLVSGRVSHLAQESVLLSTVCAQLLSRVQLFATSWTVAHQAPLSTGFPRQEYQSRLSFPSPGNLPNPGIEPASSALAGRFITAELPGKPVTGTYCFFLR